MHWQVWLAFAAAAALIGIVPGPAVLAIVGYGIGAGRRVALAGVAGMAVGNAVAMVLSLAGVGALLAASAVAFAVVKWTGALYLIGLGAITLWGTRGAAPEPGGPDQAPATPRGAFASTVLVGTFHPKTIVFFVAFVPQFISPSATYAPQAAVLVATFVGVVSLTDATYALLASRAATLLRGPRFSLWSRRTGGAVLVASGVATAAART